MTEYKTLRVPEDAYEQAQQARQETGDTWAEYLRRCSNNPPEEINVVDADHVTEALLDELPEQTAQKLRGMQR